MELHRARVDQEAAAYKAEIELTVQRQRILDEAEEKIAHAEREAEMLDKEREVAKMRADYDSERTRVIRDAQQKEYQLREYEVVLKQQEFEQRSRAEALEQQRRMLEQQAEAIKHQLVTTTGGTGREPPDAAPTLVPNSGPLPADPGPQSAVQPQPQVHDSESLENI